MCGNGCMSRDGGVGAEFRPCAPQAKIHRFVHFFLKKKNLYGKFPDFLTIWWKAPFWLVENQKKMEI